MCPVHLNEEYGESPQHELAFGKSQMDANNQPVMIMAQNIPWRDIAFSSNLPFPTIKNFYPQNNGPKLCINYRQS